MYWICSSPSCRLGGQAHQVTGSVQQKYSSRLEKEVKEQHPESSRTRTYLQVQRDAAVPGESSSALLIRGSGFESLRARCAQAHCALLARFT